MIKSQHQGVWARSIRNMAISGIVLAASTGMSLGQSYMQFKHPLPMIQRSVLVNVEGPMGKIAVDPRSGRMFFAARRAGSLEVLDRQGMKTVQSIKELNEPTGLWFLEDQRRLALTSGDGTLKIYSVSDEGELKEERSVQLEGEADGVRYDTEGKKLWIGHGKFVSSLDPATGTRGKKITVPGFPEGLAVDPKSNRLFVNIASTGQVLVIDRDKEEIISTWDLKDAKGNFPMALDAEGGRLFVATRSPARLLVLDSKDGKEIARLDAANDADDLWWDAPSKRVFLSAGGDGGKAAMYLQESETKYVLDQQISTAAGTRTSVLVPSQRRFIATAPKLAESPTFVYIFIIPSSPTERFTGKPPNER